jgi:hypothetical protein
MLAFQKISSRQLSSASRAANVDIVPKSAPPL